MALNSRANFFHQMAFSLKFQTKSGSGPRHFGFRFSIRVSIGGRISVSFFGSFRVRVRGRVRVSFGLGLVPDLVQSFLALTIIMIRSRRNRAIPSLTSTSRGCIVNYAVNLGGRCRKVCLR